MQKLGERLAHEVSAFLVPAKFQYIRTRNVFLRKEPHGFSEFLWVSHPTVLEGVLGQNYSLVIGVRHNVIETAVNQLGLVIGAANQAATATVSTPLATFPLIPERQYSFFLQNSASDKDIEKAAGLIHICFNDALSYFERYTSLHACAEGLNSNPTSRAHSLLNNLERRMYRAVASASLAQLLDFESIVESWRSVASSVLPPKSQASAIAKLEQLLDILGPIGRP